MKSVDPQELQLELEKIGVAVADSAVPQLSQYCERLWQWNEQVNLTRHTDIATFVSRDVYDTVHLAEHLSEGDEVLDIGSGGGVPGIILAIIRPDLQLTLCDTVGKKARILDDLVSQLQLPVPVYSCRAEQLLDDLRFRSLVARAVGPLWKMCRWFENRWGLFDQLLVIKGPNWVNERGEARHRGLLSGVELRKLSSYPMLGTESESVILRLRRETKASGSQPNAS